MKKYTVQELIKTSSYVDGSWASSGAKTFKVINPANQEVVATIDDAGTDLVNQAIDSADQAFAEWSALTADARSAILKRWYALIMENQDVLAEIMTLEQGKPLREAKGEVGYGASFIEWFAEEARRVYGDISPPPVNDRKVLTLRQPVGVVGAVTPWNFPNAMITRKAAPALAVGCTIVVKPSSLTPLSALAMAQLAADANIPKGVMNVVVSTNSRGSGEILTSHPSVRKFTFTGSTQVGKILMKQCTTTVKKVSMELGGNAPFIVFEDANLDIALKGLMIAKFRNAGQTCVSANRIFVHSSVYDSFCQKVVSAVSALKIGNGLDPQTDIGPLINEDAVNSIDTLIQNAVKAGAKIECGGVRLDIGKNYYQPTVLSNVSADMDLSCEEQFGPVASIIPFNDEAEVVRMANDTIYGLAAYFFTEDYRRQWRVGAALDFGLIGMNEGLISTVVAPFGGFKQSGVGREGSKYGLNDFLEYKYMCTGAL